MIYVCLFLPVFIALGIRRCLNLSGIQSQWYNAIIEYGIYTIVNILLSMLVYSVLNGNQDFLFYNTQENGFSILIYLNISVIISVLLPFLEKYIRTYFTFHLLIGNNPIIEKSTLNRLKPWLLFGAAGIIAIFTLIRCLDNTVWSDEVFSVKLARASFMDTIQMTAADVHPPLFYIVLKIIVRLVGYGSFSLHLSAVLPFLSLLLWGITIFYKKFGFRAAFIFTLMLGIMPCNFIWMISIRMYMLACFFVTLCFYEGYMLISDGSKKHWLYFTLCGLGAAYSHYFALVAVGIIYLCIFAVLIFRNRKAIRACLLCAGVCVCGYLPWMFYFIKSLARVNDSYWITEIPTWKECKEFIFGDGIFGNIMFGFLLIAIIIILLRTFGILHAIDRKECGHHKIELQWRNNQKKIIDNEFILILIAFITVALVILFGVIYSYALKPIFLVRYLFPLVGIIWITFAIVISKLSSNKILFLFFVLFILVNCFPLYIESYKAEVKINVGTKQTQQFVKENIVQNSIMVSNIPQLNNDIFEYYFPNSRHKSYDELEIANIQDSHIIYLFYDKEIDNNLKNLLEVNDINNIFLFQSSLGKYNYYLYKLQK